MAKEKTKFISLLTASAKCDYSQEYLSLRARQGKRKSKKLGRNWFTTEEWLNEYLRSPLNGKIKDDFYLKQDSEFVFKKPLLFLSDFLNLFLKAAAWLFAEIGRAHV